MSSPSAHRFPKLRPVEARPISYKGDSFILLRDPLKLTDKTLLVPRVLGPALALCDGTREDTGALAASLAVRFGLQLDAAVLGELLTALDDAVLLDNDRFVFEKQRATEEYRNARFRPPAIAGASYPANPEGLRAMLQGFVDARQAPAAAATSFQDGRGLVSPHIDYPRGGPVYAEVWTRAAEMVREASLVILLGTDHCGGDATITLTKQNYATPFGVLPTARGIVDSLAEVVGPDAAFEGELRHRGEHSIELAAVWLHHIREGRPCELVPILCGSFSRFTKASDDPEQHTVINGLVELLKTHATSPNTVVVAAGDLSHVGPAFGGPPVDLAGRARLKDADDELIEHICAGDAAGFLSAITRVEDRNNVCGVSPIYLALRMLGDCRGYNLGYDRCPADEEGTSLVSICGTLLS
jgi:AmmeMemoRadiSam system protein B